MIPQLWIELEALPLTANGKIDVTALRKGGRCAETVYAPPRTNAGGGPW